MIKLNFYSLNLIFLLSTLIAYSGDLPQGYPETSRMKINLNNGWNFFLGNPEGELYKEHTDISNWKLISVPHTLELTSLTLDDCEDDKTQPTFHRKVGWYKKNIRVGDNNENKIYLEFEGAHQVTDLWVNGKHVGQHSIGGYTPFHFDVSNFVNYGADNEITLRVDNRRRDDVPPDPGPFDYIKFSGLYRDVYLVETNPLHITFNWESLRAGINITTPTVDPVNMNAVISIKTVVRNETSETKTTTVVTRVIDADGVVVLKLKETQKIETGRETEFNQIGSIEDNLRLWSIEDPYLYRVNTLVMDGDKSVDCIENRTGFRKVELTHDQGLLLNGKPVKLIGTNRHQHYGYIGDAMPNSLHYKDVLQIKQLGMNVIRTAHYPQDDALLDACDELGVLAYEEAPTWIDVGNDAWFDNLEKAARIMVRNHRNHPSIIIWGAGINHRGYVARLHNAVKQEDPTRLTASQGARWTGWQTSGLTDLYAQMCYGPYYWSVDEYMLAMEGGRGPAAVNEYLDHPMKLGLISWTAHAYYTFHIKKQPKDRTRSGLMTVFRYPKPWLMWYPTELIEKPSIYVNTAWAKETEKLEVFSNADELELILNDKLIGTYKPSTDEKYKNLKHAPYLIPMDNYADGKLEINGHKGGELIVSKTIYTPDEPYKIVLELDTAGRNFTADGSDLLVGYAKILDKNGTLLTNADINVHFTVKGSAKIVGDEVDINANPMFTTYGVAPVLIRAGNTPDEINITAKAKGLKPGLASVKTIASQTDMIVSNAKPIYDYEQVRVDIGELEQLIQFDWIPWSNADNASSTMKFTEMGGFSATLKSVENDSLLRWLGEMNVIGKYGFTYGEGVFGADPKGMVLEFSGLKKGNYKIRTTHHAPRSNTDSMDPNQEKLRSQTIYKLPYSENISITLTDAMGERKINDVTVSVGKDMQTKEVGFAEILFTSDGENPVKIILNDSGEEKGVWLNAFVLSEWF